MMMSMIGSSSICLLSVDDIDGHGLPIVDHSKIGHSIEHRSRPIGHVSEFRRPIVLQQHVDLFACKTLFRRVYRNGDWWERRVHVYLRESVMEVVSSLSCSLDVRPHGFDGSDGWIVRFVSKHVSGRVDQAERPSVFSTFRNGLIFSKRSKNDSQGWIKCEDVSENASDVECNERSFSPEVSGDERGKDEADQSRKGEIVSERWWFNDAILSLMFLCFLFNHRFTDLNWPSLESEYRVVPQIRNIDFGSHFLQFLALSREKPSNVRVEKTSSRVVRISLSIRPFVMASMITGPFDNVILKVMLRINHHGSSNVL